MSFVPHDYTQYAFVEDIVLGTKSLRGSEDFSTWVGGAKVFDIGPVPPRLGGIKTYDTSDDEVMIEMPLMWGSQSKVR